MRILREWLVRLAGTIRPRRSDRDLREELRLHMEMSGDRHGLEAALEAVRDQRELSWLRDLARDLRYGWRGLVKAPLFSLVAIASLALGIGATTAIFSLVDAVLLRSLPVTRPDELVFLQAAGSQGTNGAPPYPCFDRFRRESSSFAGMAAFATDQLPVQVDGAVEQVFGQVASGNYFEVLGIAPALGRLMTMKDEALDPPVAVIGFGFWQRRFGGDPHVVGKQIVFRDQAYTIVGVTPRGFWGLDPGRQVDLTLPITLEREAIAEPGQWWLEAVARRRPEVPAERARAQIDAIFQRFMSGQATSGLRLTRMDHMQLTPAGQGLNGLRSRFGEPLYGLTVVAGLVLLIACVNLGSLLLLRGAARGREFAIRLATGAGSSRLCRQVLTETGLLFLLGSVAGMVTAYAAIHGLTAFFAVGRTPILLDVPFGWRLGAFASALALVAALATGVWPALRAGRSGFKTADGRVAGSPHVSAANRGLVAAQAAIAFVLIVTALVFLRTIVNLRTVDLGFTNTHVLTMSLDPLLPPGAAAETRPRFWAQVLDRVRALPAVTSASLSVLTPLSGRDTGRVMNVPGAEPANPRDRTIHVNHVSEDYFRTFGISIVAGRAFSPQDAAGSSKVVMINETAARAYFAGRNPIGEHVVFPPDDRREIIAVVGDYKHMNLRQQVPRFAFVPIWQPLGGLSRVTLSVAADRPRVLEPAIAKEIAGIYPETLISDVLRVDQQIDVVLLTERLVATLAVVFACVAVVLAAIGVYGVLSHAVAQRRTEFGIRLALGAPRSRIAASVVRQIATHLALGIVVAVPLSIAAARMARGLLFGVAPSDVSNYLISGMLLLCVASVSAALPARRACRIDPAVALKDG
jgi:predicted permease